MTNPEEPIQITLEDAIESNVPFRSEPVVRTLGRMSWLQTRQNMEMICALHDAGFTIEQIVTVNTVLDKFHEDWTDFIEEGVEAPDDYTYADGDTHPKQDEYEEYVEAMIEQWDEAETEIDDTKTDLENFFVSGPQARAVRNILLLGGLDGDELFDKLKNTIEVPADRQLPEK